MLKNDNGFFLAELFLSLSTLLLVCSILVPLYIDLVAKREQLEIEHEAVQILYEELISEKVEQTTNHFKTIIKNGIEYEFVRRPTNSGEMEVCIRFDIYSKEKEKCELTN
ncbi:hypothetical protein H1Z61_01285 [Bacillus aquiflavi]|uniref:Type II secretion system protein n=1 Tax=Bacillus aquiflavi TaxID=2672567 RepID=A0A6B3VQE4_9BACI|nr:hypothetical protein [Bacillus aquiflavi]MBA4535803.1 hypothetical protein [Bacillus aquiflavi]NEY80179.1 hypothetical protein [Bacillus aquiflavi]UAC47230.1 hypothetical protein K6959_10880 [Bacillus aquiflavi]